MLDNSGNVIGRQAHLPFGEDFGESGTQEKHHFTSYEMDGESGTDYAVNRQYSQSVGRFMRPDPYSRSYNPGDPQSFNRYAYVRNDAINKVDPSGLDYYACQSIMVTYYPGNGEPPISGWVSVCGWVQDRPRQRPNPPIIPPISISPEELRKYELAKGLRDFVDNSGCSSVLKDKGFAKKLKNVDLQTIDFFDVNQIQDRLASDFFGNTQGVVPGMSLGTFFDAYAPPGGATTLSPDRSQTHIVGGRSGIYSRGGISSFFRDGQPRSSFLVHELLHYTTGEDDATLLQDFGVTRREGETTSQALSRYLNGGCKDEDKK